MADWLTAEQRLALKHRYGTKGSKTPEEMAIEEACELSSEVRELWESKDDSFWSGRQDEYAQLLWPRVFRELRKLGFMEDVLAVEPETSSSSKPRADPQDDMSGGLQARDELDLGGNGYTKDEIKAAVDLLDRGQLGARSLEREAPMSYPRARRLWKWFDKRAARYDKEHKPSLYAAPGFKWVKRKTRSGERLTLVRTGSD
jgi:hypothetical protein